MQEKSALYQLSRSILIFHYIILLIEEIKKLKAFHLKGIDKSNETEFMEIIKLSTKKKGFI